MTVQELINELQKIVHEHPERADHQVEDQEKRTIGWVRRGGLRDEQHKVVVVLPEVDW